MACASIYEVAAMGLLSSSDDAVGDAARRTLRTALAKVDGSHDTTKNAWTMRHALDEVDASATAR